MNFDQGAKAILLNDGLNTILSNIERSRKSIFKHGTSLNVFIYWWSNLNTLFLAWNEGTSNLIGLSLDLLNHSSNWLKYDFFLTSNELKRVHLLVIKLEHPIFGFEHSSTIRYAVVPKLTWLLCKVSRTKVRLYNNAIIICYWYNDLRAEGNFSFLSKTQCGSSRFCLTLRFYVK